MKKHAGFTLLELMITVTVAAILLAVGVPGYQEFVRNNRQVTEVNGLVSTLQIARSEAVARNQRIGICPSTNGADCAGNATWEPGWIVFVDLDRDGVHDNGEEILHVIDGPQQMTVRAEVTALNYRPNGRVVTFPDTTGANFVFCDGRGADHARVVQLELTGRPNASTTKIGGVAANCPSS